MTFPIAPFERLVRIVSWATIVVLSVIAVIMLIGLPIAGVVFVLAMVGIFGASWAYAPAGYEWGRPARLGVRRRAAGVRWFDVTGVAEPDRSASASKYGIRLWGSGGFLGFYGVFWRRDLGRFRAYVTDRQASVVLETRQGLVVVSPADGDALVATVREATS